MCNIPSCVLTENQENKFIKAKLTLRMTYECNMIWLNATLKSLCPMYIYFLFLIADQCF